MKRMRKFLAALIFSEFGIVVAFLLISAPFLIWYSLEPETCHDRVSLMSQNTEQQALILRLTTQKSHQRQIEKYLRDFRNKDGWQYKERYRSKLRGRTIFRGSSCKTGRGLVLANHLISTTDLSVTTLTVFPEEKDSVWKQDIQILYDETSDLWPGEVDFINVENKPIEPPEWLQTND